MEFTTFSLAFFQRLENHIAIVKNTIPHSQAPLQLAHLKVTHEIQQKENFNGKKRDACDNENGLYNQSPKMKLMIPASTINQYKRYSKYHQPIQ